MVGIRDNAFIANTMIDKHKNEGIYLVFVDFRAASDAINRKY